MVDQVFSGGGKDSFFDVRGKKKKIKVKKAKTKSQIDVIKRAADRNASVGAPYFYRAVSKADRWKSGHAKRSKSLSPTPSSMKRTGTWAYDRGKGGSREFKASDFLPKR